MTKEEIKVVGTSLGLTFVTRATKPQMIAQIVSAQAAVSATPEVAISAASETLVAEHKTEEVVDMTPVQVLKEIQKKNNHAALERTGKGSHLDQSAPEKYLNQNRIKLVNEIKDKGLAFLSSLGELPVTVLGFSWFLNEHNQFVPQGQKKNRFGMIQLQVAPGVLEYHVWNAAIKKFEWMDFASYTLDATRRVDVFHAAVAPAGYNGVLTLPIYHSEGMGGFFVMLPNVPMKGGESFRPIFKVADHRWATGGSTANVGRFNAAVTAYLRMSQSQFIQSNPMNRHGFNENCSTCAHSQWLGSKNGLDDDLDAKDAKSNVILNSISTDESRDGQYIPQMLCTARKVLVDEEIVTVMNEAAMYDKQALAVNDEFINDQGVLETRVGFRYPGKGELVIDGQIRKVAGLRAEGTKSLCEGCPFYSKNERKSDSKVNAEVVSERERVGNNTAVVGKDIFVAKYYTDMVRADRQVVQTQNNRGEWITAYPGQVLNAKDIRIKGIGGLFVYSSAGMKEALPTLGALNFTAPVADFDSARATDENKIQVLFTAARNFRDLTQEKANEVFALATAKPASLDKGQSVRWDRAVEWLRQSVIWAQESAANRNRPLFADKFFTTVNEALPMLITDDFITTAQERDRQGELAYGLGYRDIDFKDMVKYLEETETLDIIDHILETGESFHVVDGDVSRSIELGEGERTDAEMVAGALQHSLNAQINTLVYGVRREANPQEAIDKLKVCDEVKAYILGVVLTPAQ
jgi:hypothetical protein